MKIKTPVEGYNGKVAGVAFVDGAGETDDPNAIAYFRRHGYDVAEGEDAKPKGRRRSPAKKAAAKAPAKKVAPRKPAADDAGEAADGEGGDVDGAAG